MDEVPQWLIKLLRHTEEVALQVFLFLLVMKHLLKAMGIDVLRKEHAQETPKPRPRRKQKQGKPDR
jgi:hypothetical protein